MMTCGRGASDPFINFAAVGKCFLTTSSATAGWQFFPLHARLICKSAKKPLCKVTRARFSDGRVNAFADAICVSSLSTGTGRCGAATARGDDISGDTASLIRCAGPLTQGTAVEKNKQRKYLLFGSHSISQAWTMALSRCPHIAPQRRRFNDSLSDYLELT